MKLNAHQDTILVVDDDQIILELMTEILNIGGYNVICAENGRAALEIIKNDSIDLLLLDLKMPDMDGMEVLKQVIKQNPDQLVIMISGHGSIENAVEATKNGAYDFLEKPMEAQRVLLTVKNALEKTSLIRVKHFLLEETRKRFKMVAVSPSMNQIFGLIDRIAPSNTRVLILGESGTGKELVARAIHLNSKRVSAPFYSLNCAAIPEELIESELFGHVKGAFTHAIADKKGAFSLAHNGTLFLDEIGDLSLRAQAKVLRVIEDGEIIPVGGQQVENVSVRIISATNHDLEDMIKANTFREDLYHRINVVTIKIQPLRERREDIGPLAQHFVREACNENNIVQKKLADDAIAILSNQKWKGNARELRNFMERLVVLSDSETIIGKTVLAVLQISDKNEAPFVINDLRVARENFEKLFITNKLIANNWNVSKTANIIGVERTHLYRKIKKYNIKEY